jgi:hypothetical protein
MITDSIVIILFYFVKNLLGNVHTESVYVKYIEYKIRFLTVAMFVFVDL